MEAFVNWLRATWLSQAINANGWIWPAAESLHFIGLSLLLGIVGFFDFRLMGLFKRVPMSAARQLLPFAVAGFAINLITGLIFLIGIPEQYAFSWVWWAKVGALAVAGLNALVFEKTLSRRIVYLETGEDTPTLAKAIGAVSLLSWLAVLYFGRMLPFLGDSF
jgi:hypothetical protein